MTCSYKPSAAAYLIAVAITGVYFTDSANAATFTESSPTAFAAESDVPIQHCDAVFYPAPPTAEESAKYPVGHVFAGTESQCLVRKLKADEEYPATVHAYGSNGTVVLKVEATIKAANKSN